MKAMTHDGSSAGRSFGSHAGTVLAAALVIPAAWLTGCSETDPDRKSMSGGSGQLARWPRFRGPGGAGTACDGEYPTFWDATTGEGIVWKTPVPLPGYGSPIVWGDHVFLTGACERTREVYCFDAASGGMLWRAVLDGVPGSRDGPEDLWNEASYAAPTPATNGVQVCAMFANGDIAGFDFQGRRLWARSLGLPDNDYGHASSPVMWRNRVLVQFDQAVADDGKSRLIALDSRTGQTVWQVKRPVGQSWSSPILIRATGRRLQTRSVACEASRDLVVLSGKPWVIAYDPATGEEIWRADCMKDAYWAAPSPVFAGGTVFTGADGGYLTATKPDGRGDVSRTHVRHISDVDLPNIPSPVSDGELVFVLAEYGLLTCYDALSGEQLWQEDFSDADREFQASPVLAGDRLYFIDNHGVTYVVRAGRIFERISRSELGEPCPGASPAFAVGRIYIRGSRHIYCIGAVDRSCGRRK